MPATNSHGLDKRRGCVHLCMCVCACVRVHASVNRKSLTLGIRVKGRHDFFIDFLQLF